MPAIITVDTAHTMARRGKIGTAISPRETQVGRIRAHPGLLLAAAVGLGLCWFGGAQAVGALLQIRGTTLLERLRVARPGSLPDVLEAARADFEQSDRWRRDPANDRDIATLFLRMTVPGDEPGAARVPAAAARGALERSLQEAPGDAEAWIWLAEARLVEDGPSQPAIEAFRRSLVLARYEPGLLVWRCQVGLALYPMLDGSDRAALSEQIGMLAAVSMDDLAKVAHISGRLPVVAAALSKDIATLTRFSRSIRALH